MDSCWSCLVVIENGAKFCPLCGADQTPLSPISGGEAAIVRGSPSVAMRWGVPVVAILCLLGAMSWYIMPSNDDNSSTKSEVKAENTLLNIRLALSQYAILKGDDYPLTLDSLYTQTTSPKQNAKIDGYTIVYTPQRSEKDGGIRSFSLLGQPEKANCLNFYIDQTGVLRATRESRAARIDDPPI
jgi:hypothetical protein